MKTEIQLLGKQIDIASRTRRRWLVVLIYSVQHGSPLFASSPTACPGVCSLPPVSSTSLSLRPSFSGPNPTWRRNES